MSAAESQAMSDLAVDGHGAPHRAAARPPPSLKVGWGCDSTPVNGVSWPVEDPSEFRPELAPGGQLEHLGKDKDSFRIYYEVGSLSFDGGAFSSLNFSVSIGERRAV